MLNDVMIAPSILAADFCNLGSDIQDVKTADYLHFDVMDGNFVPNTSFGLAVLEHVAKASPIPVDVHLMVSNPDETALMYAQAGASIVTFHAEATNHAHRLAQTLHEAGVKVGVALNPGTPVGMIESYIECVDLVLVMSVNPGFGGQQFIPFSLRKCKQVRALSAERHCNPLVEVDGGITASNAGEVVAAGANLLVAGSAIYKQEDRAAAIAQIREAGRKGIVRSA